MDKSFLGSQKVFLALWFAQLISIIGSEMTRFALPVWIFQSSGNATFVSTAAAFAFIGQVLLSPFAGVLVDRWDRKRTLVFCDLALAANTALLVAAVVWIPKSQTLEMKSLMPIYILVLISGILTTLQFPGLAATTSLLVKDSQLTRANGLISIAESAGILLSPLLAGVLLANFSISKVLQIDLLTFLASALVIALIAIPNPKNSQRADPSPNSTLWREIVIGMRYIINFSGLFGILLITTFTNFMFSLSFVLFSPMVLLLSSNDTALLGLLMSLGGFSQLMGGIIMSAWGGPRNRIHGVLAGTAILGVLGPFVIGLSSRPVFWGVGLMATMALVTAINVSSRAIWQARVPQNLQGRIFGIRRMVSSSLGPLGFFLAGPLVDRVLEPYFAPPAGTGYRFSFMMAGGIIALIGISGYASIKVRQVDEQV